MNDTQSLGISLIAIAFIGLAAIVIIAWLHAIIIAIREREIYPLAILLVCMVGLIGAALFAIGGAPK